MIITGPGIESVEITGDRLEMRVGSNMKEHPLEGLEHIVLLGPASLSPDVPAKLLRAGVRMSFVSENGWPIGELAPYTDEDAEALMAQCRSASDPVACLKIARLLIHAKMTNYAALAHSADNFKLADHLLQTAQQVMDCKSIDSLRGLEGHAAAEWYGNFTKLLANGFVLRRRIAPDATDPVNVMLNIGHTLLFRHLNTAIRSVGLSPSVGFLHKPGARFASLAADIQEPFRHLVDRAVILASRRIKPRHFIEKESGSYPLVMEPHAARTFHLLLQRSLKQSVVAQGQAEPRAWFAQMVATNRSLRRHLIDSDHRFRPFIHITNDQSTTTHQEEKK